MDYGVRSHEGEVGGTYAHPFFLHNELLGRLLTEHVELYVGSTGKTQGCILHLELLELIDGVVVDGLGPEKGVQEGYALGFGVVFVIVVLVFDGIYAVHGILNIADTEKAPVVGFGGGKGALEEHGRIRVVLVQHHRSGLEGLQGLEILHKPGKAHGIYLGARGEHKRISGEHIALVVVCDGSGKVQGIGGVGVKVAFKAYHHGFSPDCSLGLFFKRGREVYAVGVLYFYVFVEREYNLGLVRIHVHGAGQGRDLGHYGRNGVFVPAGRGRSGICTAPREHKASKDESRGHKRYELFQIHISVLVTFSMPSMAWRFFIISSRVSLVET